MTNKKLTDETIKLMLNGIMANTMYIRTTIYMGGKDDEFTIIERTKDIDEEVGNVKELLNLK